MVKPSRSASAVPQVKHSELAREGRRTLSSPATEELSQHGGKGAAPALHIWWLVIAALLLTVAIVSEQTSFADITILISVLAGIVATSLRLCRRDGKALVWLFVVSVAGRLLLIVALEAFPPQLINDSGQRVEGAIYADEGYYITQARVFADDRAAATVSWGNPYERTAFLQSLTLVFGREIVWTRLVNGLLGSVAVVVLARLVANNTGSRRMYWILATSPLLAFWSVSTLKEGYIFLGYALALSALRDIYDRRPSAMRLASGIVIVAWQRPEAAVPLIAGLAATLLLSSSVAKKRPTRGFVAVIACAVVGTAGLLTLTPAGLAERVSSAQATLFEREFEGGTVPGYSAVKQFGEPLRTVALTAYLLVSPPITAVSEPASWYGFTTAAYALHWWIVLPLFVSGAFKAVAARKSWWSFWGVMCVLWIVVAATARGGISTDAVRYRDGLQAVFILLASSGAVSRSSYRSWLAGIVLLVTAIAVARAIGVSLPGL